VNPRTYLPTALLVLLASCSSTGKSAAPAPAPGGEPQAKDDSKNEALQKKERELNYAKLQFQITELELKADERSQQNSIADAERGVRRAEEELADYLQSHKAIESAERELNTDQQKEGLRETQQEYDELESMYKDEDFAKKTKELVLSRGKARLDFSTRGLALSASRRKFQEETAQPRRERDLHDALDKARLALEDSRGAAERKKLANELQLMRAKDGLDDLQKEVEKLKSSSAKPAEKPAA
jgi:hypothetical protein